MNGTEDSTIQPLVSTLTSAGQPDFRANSPPQDRKCSQILSACSKNHRTCLRSGTAILILLWNIIVGIVYGALQGGVIGGTMNLDSLEPIKKIQIIVAGLAGIAIIQILLFPLGGLVADIWQGRYRVINFSFVMITIGFLFLSIGLGLHAVKDIPSVGISSAVLSSFFLSLGFAGFQSNAIQFGLDQLYDASNQELSLFLHWYVWTSSLGETLANIVGSFFACQIPKYLVHTFYGVAGMCLLLLLFSWYKRNSFHCEPKCNNPYGIILRVLKFVAKHKYPLRRSARTYCGDMTPTRMDNANTVFGGPFSVEVVEDVKTVLRMFMMMLLICPVFFYDVSVNSLFPFYGIHLGGRTQEYCRVKWILLEAGNISRIVTCLIIPSYIVFVYPKVNRLVPRILHRMIFGIILLVVAVVVMWLIFLAAIAQNQYAMKTHTNKTAPDLECLFFANISTDNKGLNFNSVYLVLPEILIGIAFPVVNIAVLEFVSAQSPFPMKGLLLGTFYALRGMFILFGCSSIYIFTAKVFEKTNTFSDCGFIFYGVNIFLGIVCVCVSIKAVKWYQYRKREEQPYDHRYVEDYYSRYASKKTDSCSHSNTHEESRHYYGSCRNSHTQVSVNSE